MEYDYEGSAASPNPRCAGEIHWGRRWRGAAWGSAAAILVTSGVVAAAVGASGGQLTKSPEPVATTVRASPTGQRPQYAAQAPETPGQLVCTPTVLQAACPPSRPPAGAGTGAPADAVAWFNKAKGPFNAVQDGLKSAGAAMQAQNVDGIRSACTQVRDSSQELGNTLPSPDAALTKEVRGAVDELITAADMCLAPDATSNGQAIMSHVQNANAHFSNAQQIIESKS